MECYICKEKEMKCIDDVNYETARIDWFECQNCGVKATVEYSPTDRSHVKKTTFFVGVDTSSKKDLGVETHYFVGKNGKVEIVDQKVCI